MAQYLEKKAKLPGLRFPWGQGDKIGIIESILGILRGGIPGGLGQPGPGFEKTPGCQFSCPLLRDGKGGRFPGGVGGRKNGPLPPLLQAENPFEKMLDSYEKMLRQIISGNDQIMSSWMKMCRKMLELATGSYDRIGQRYSIMHKDLYGGLADYTLHLGAVSGYVSKAFAAFRTMNPFAAAAASFGLIALGQMLRSLSFGRGGSAPSGTGGRSSMKLAAAGAGGVSAESSWRGPQVVNVYINGIRSSNVYEVDRGLNRAGVDRELRNRIRELVRTGSNPIREY